MTDGTSKAAGSAEERAAQAVARIEAIKPKFIVCNNCQEEITDVYVMDSRGMVGIDGAFAGMCDCGHSTWALAGDREAVANALMSIDEVTGGESVLGSMPIRRN